MEDQEEQSASKAVPWDKMPTEVVGNVMKFLEGADLKSCRLINKITIDLASRQLFSTLKIGPEAESWERACPAMMHPVISKYVRRVEYQGVGDATHSLGSAVYLAPVMDFVQSSKPTSVSLSGLLHYEANYLLLRDECRGCLVNTTRLYLSIKTFDLVPASGDLFEAHWSKDMVGPAHKLSTQLSLLQEADFGFSEPPFGSFQEIVASRISTLFLGLNCASLTSITLSNIVATENALIDFLNRHQDTSRSVTLFNFRLHAGGGPDDFSNGLAELMRFILVLNEKTQLEDINLQNTLEVGGDYDEYKIYCFEADATQGSTTVSLRQKVEDFICHRREFPFQSLQPYLTDLAKGTLESIGDHFVFKVGDQGAKMLLSRE